ncbi:unnamed protein product [Nippostrongylus brasiliensis]|uniref:Uncharacterized protein n=1 Tax=Nippostrongylus brasiliensis TaxID=27835 RepID=A0A0N4XM16_NIPBR|nr:unnamed protein product [Nippostrongylus brasiliensis]
MTTIRRPHLKHVDVSPAKTSHGVDPAERKATQRSPEKHMEKNIFERLEDDEYSQTGMRRSRARQMAVERVRRPMCSTAREELSLTLGFLEFRVWLLVQMRLIGALSAHLAFHDRK